MRKIEMLLDRDEFLVSYDPGKATEDELIATIKEAGYTAQIVGGRSTGPASAANSATLPVGFALLDEALAQGRRENKLLVLDFGAEWCAPCKRMERTTFTDARVAALLRRCVWIKIDTDTHPDLSRRLGVVGLPDIRFVTPDGRIVRRLKGFQDAETFAVELERFISKIESK